MTRGSVRVRLGLWLLALTGAAWLLWRTAPRSWPSSFAALPSWLASSPPETPVLALATVAAYGCLVWLAVALVAAACDVGLPGRAFASRLLGIAVVSAAAGVLAAGPAAADGGPFDRPVPASTPVAALASPAVAPRPPGPAPGPAVVVRRGDTLWGIAASRLGRGAPPVSVAREWPRWYAANRGVVGPDPGLIRPGQRLVPPGDAR